MPGEPHPTKPPRMTVGDPTPLELVEYAQDEHARAIGLWHQKGKGGEFCDAMKELQNALAALRRALERNHDDA